MKFNKVFVRVVAICLAVLLAAAILLSVIGRAASDEGMEALRNEQTRLSQERREIQARLYELEENSASPLERKTVIDENLRLAVAEADNIQAQIDEYSRLIFQREYEVTGSVEKEEACRALYKERVRIREESGALSYFELILGAENWSDLLARYDYVQDVISYDESVHKDLVAAIAATENAGTRLEETRAECEDTKLRLADKQAELQKLVEEADAYVAGIEGSLDSYIQLAAEQETAEKELLSRIEDEASEIERMRSVSSTGTFIWPSEDSRLVTYGFGGHTHPVYGVYRVHYGVDIGANYGTKVMAADGGIVVAADYDSACGNYVVVTHGGGCHTFYGNLSKSTVATGDTVEQGTVIGLVGSTGISSKPHLHFEIIKNGVKENPLTYYTNYELSPNA